MRGRREGVLRSLGRRIVCRIVVVGAGISKLLGSWTGEDGSGGDGGGDVRTAWDMYPLLDLWS